MEKRRLVLTIKVPEKFQEMAKHNINKVYVPCGGCGTEHLVRKGKRIKRCSVCK